MRLKEAFNDGIIKKNTTSNIKVPSIKSEIKSINYLETDDMNKILNYIEEHAITPQRFSIYISLLSGMRLGEILALTYDVIDPNNKTIYIIQNKTNKYPFEYVSPKTPSSIRTITMPDSFFIQLDRYKKTYPKTDRHFLGDNHEQNYYARELKKIIKETETKEITFHGLRHTHASYLINNGVDVAYVSERLGHSNISITQRTYFHLLQDKRALENDKTMALFS